MWEETLGCAGGLSPLLTPLECPPLTFDLHTATLIRTRLQLSGTFDLVIVPNTMQYVRDPFLSVKILYDLLAPGGYLILTSPFIQVIGWARGVAGMRFE